MFQYLKIFFKQFNPSQHCNDVQFYLILLLCRIYFYKHDNTNSLIKLNFKTYFDNSCLCEGKSLRGFGSTVFCSSFLRGDSDLFE